MNRENESLFKIEDIVNYDLTRKLSEIEINNLNLTETFISCDEELRLTERAINAISLLPYQIFNESEILPNEFTSVSNFIKSLQRQNDNFDIIFSLYIKIKETSHFDYILDTLYSAVTGICYDALTNETYVEVAFKNGESKKLSIKKLCVESLIYLDQCYNKYCLYKEIRE